MFVKLYVREIAQINDWVCVGPLKAKLNKAKTAFIHKFIGHPDKLMHGGNYGKDMVSLDKIKPVLESLVPKEERLAVLLKAFMLYSRLRKVWIKYVILNHCTN